MDQNKSEQAMLRVAVAIVTIAAVGTAMVPAVLAVVYGWPWLLAYPAALGVLVTWASRGKGGGNHGG